MEPPSSLSRQNIVTNFGRFAKLFIILGELANKCDHLPPFRFSLFKTGFPKGFYWTGDILSTALALEYGQEKTCGFRIFADLTGLFSVS